MTFLRKKLNVTREHKAAREKRESKMNHDALIDYSSQTDDSMFSVAFKKLQKIVRNNE